MLRPVTVSACFTVNSSTVERTDWLYETFTSVAFVVNWCLSRTTYVTVYSAVGSKLLAEI
ncbi:hypothetical protein [Bacillus thuringiensis]|uniref:Uncharacterized protein n=1 Tax=Bacillus thuringiensis serovar andalousiensis TaxID=257985 RepID=A0A6H0TS82_BACTU|nr:hypothetical protein [Bacillus thuringiensis]QIW22514.1 hypothetical protein EVG22_31905 [Bacillus thuringiensis serovar andalousiensis]